MASGLAPLPRLPFLLLGAMTFATFVGPFVMVAAIRGGDSRRWPPDRPVEWFVIGLVIASVLILFTACVTVRLWYRGDPSTLKRPASRPSDPSARPSQN